MRYELALKCPNCDERITLKGHEDLGQELRCPKCAAVLRFPRSKGLLFLFSILTIVLGAVASALVGLALGGHLTDSTASIFLLQGNPIPGVVFWSGVILGISLGVFAQFTAKLQVVRLASICARCGSTIKMESAHFCPKCGAELDDISGKKRIALDKLELWQYKVRHL